MINYYDTLCQYLIEEAKKWIGTTESGADNCGPEVELFQKAVDGKSQGEAWCLAFIQFCIKKAEERFESEFGEPVNHWMYPTEHCMTLWNKMPLESKLKELPHAGCLVVWQHFKDGQPTSSGHIGLITEILGVNRVKTIEGNTSPNLTGDQRNGDGVYEKERSLLSKGSLQLKGFIMPWNKDI